jgi:DNA-binding NarL/FixJ family response regulator
MRSPGLVQRQPSPLVGRTEELAFCEELLTQPDATGVVITGAAGVGKTRLASEVLEAAADRGYATVRVTATEAGRAIPLGPFAGFFPVDSGVDAAPAQLLGLARRAICAREDGRRVVLLVDDAHLLDPASAMLVQQVTAAREAMVIATVRSGEPVADAVIALWKDHGCEYLELQPLSLEESGVLVESLVGGDVDGQTKHRLWEASRGVPLMVRELVLDGVKQGSFVPSHGMWRWDGQVQAGGRLRELIGARVGQLDESERSLLELVGVGEPVAWSLLEADERAAAEMLMRLQLIVVERDGRRLELRLAHPLYGEAVRAGMPPTRLALVQARLAVALEATGLRRSADLLRFAVWQLEAGGAASSEVVLRAANVAFNSFDLPLAERLARAASDGGRGFEAQRAVAKALNAQGRFAEADSILLRLAAEARTDAERADVAAGRFTSLAGKGRDAEAEAMLRDVGAAVSDDDARRTLDFALYFAVARSGRLAEAVSGLASFVLADASGAHPEAASWLAAAFAEIGRSDDSLDLIAHWERFADNDIDLTRARIVPPAVARANFGEARILALLYCGRLTDAEAAANAAAETFAGETSAEVSAMFTTASGRVALTEGRVSAAERSFREAAAMTPADDLFFLPFPIALTAQALGHAGDHVRARNVLDEFAYPAGTWYFDPDVLLASAWAAAAEGALSEAQRLAGEAADLAEERGALSLAFLAAHDVVRLGDPGPGRARLSRLAEQVQGALVIACAEHAHAVVAGDATRIEAAAAGFAELGALLWAAEAESEAAAVHRRAGREASARAATARAAMLLERCEGARTPALALAGPVAALTPREREIATLAATGASNREIAERLVVSVRTVENSLQRAYGKLGIRNRAELAGVLQQP